MFPHEAGIDTSAQAALEHKARQATRARLDALLAAGDSVPIEIETGTPHAGIILVAERTKPGLIVLGPGRTAARVARSAGVPVLIAGPSPTEGGVLAATDFSDPALPAVHTGADEAKRRGVRFRVVHCLDIGDVATMSTASLPGMIPAPPAVTQDIIVQLESNARERLTEALTGLNAVSEGLVMLRPPVAGILEAAQADPTALIVVGTRGRSGLARLALGSVAEDVVSRAPCSVLVVPLHLE